MSNLVIHAIHLFMQFTYSCNSLIQALFTIAWEPWGLDN